ncbi:unnamed protein product, partial [Timema podura]|nr:unnamed protein product [Timema podura]
MEQNQETAVMCCVNMEWRNSQQSILRKATYKTATLRLVRNEFRELFLEIRSEKSNLSGGKNESKVGLRERLLSKKSQALQEISPVTLQEINKAKAKSGIQTGSEITPPSDKKRPLADKSVKRKLMYQVIITTRKSIRPTYFKTRFGGRTLQGVTLGLSATGRSGLESQSGVLRSGKKLCLTPVAQTVLNPEQNNVLQAALKGQNIFFTGSAGTGKSYLLRRIIAALPPDVTTATASTGVAACHIGGVTLHSFA